jgi:hypothetical protein
MHQALLPTMMGAGMIYIYIYKHMEWRMGPVLSEKFGAKRPPSFKVDDHDQGQGGRFKVDVSTPN